MNAHDPDSRVTRPVIHEPDNASYRPLGPYGLQAFAHPAIRDDDLWDRAVDAAGDEDALLQRLRAAVGVVGDAQWGGVHLGRAYRWERRGADKWTLDTAAGTGQVDAGRARADLSMDGRAYLFYGQAAYLEQRTAAGPEVLCAYETGIALNLLQS